MSKRIKIGKDKTVVLKNAFSLTVMQATNYLLPLAVLPYLARVLGPEKYGVIFFAQVFINYFMILSDYGFNLIGVRQIAQNKDDKNKLESIVSSIYNLRLILGILGFIILFIIVNSFSRFQEDSLIYYFTYGMVIGNILLPSWFFQGIEQMKYIAILNFISKLIFTLSIFFLITEEQDYLYVPLLNSFGFIISGLIGLWLLKNKYQISLKIVPWLKIKEQLSNGFHVFISNFSISAYTTTNTFILGNMVKDDIMGYYGGSEKIIQAFKFMFTPVYNATYPYFANLVSTNKKRALKEFKIGLLGSIIIGAIVCGISLYFAKEIITLVLGSDYLAGIDIFMILAILILLTPISYFLFNVVFLSLSLEKYSMKIYIAGGVINITLLVSLLSFLDSPAIAAAVSNVLTQFFNLSAALIVFYLYLKNKIRGLNG
ncbi:flippase [Winogradskyella undariae]|uniref:flippase n=1 Tax=Winogradskyella undariae TaxID=1285465 RepID=UPI00156A9CFD|nr:flippase [Winogradskyella undariae]NRR91469.1 flippase [Winogradskyella undariae]